jgi:hypothetical protein
MDWRQVSSLVAGAGTSCAGSMAKWQAMPTLSAQRQILTGWAQQSRGFAPVDFSFAGILQHCSASQDDALRANCDSIPAL